jgi:tetratricopeptide (TPR) repeat protein
MGEGGLPILYYLSLLIPLGFFYFIYRYWKRQREIITGLLFFSIAVAPVLPIFWSRIFVAADRYAYLSFIGLFIALVFILVKLSRPGTLKSAILRYTVWGILAVYGGFLVYLTHQQTKHWTNAETLLNHAVMLGKSSSNKALAYFYRGNVFQNIAEAKFASGYQTSNRNMVLNSQAYYRMTIADYDSCLAHNPEYMLAYTNRGIAYMSVSQYDTNFLEKYTGFAQLDFEKAISLDSTYADNYYNLAWIYWIDEDYRKACELWHKADELGSVVAHQPLRNYCQ